MRRPRGSPSTAQTRMYAERADVLAPQLRAEIATVPDRAHGAAALVVLMGLPGVGKSHCARLLCARLGAAHVASDELRSRLFIAPTYADQENRAVFAAAGALVDSLLAEGHRVVLDATNLVARNREAAVAIARTRDVPVTYVRITAPEEDIRRRLAARRAARAADDHSEADERIYERMRAQPFEPPAEGFADLENGSNVATEVERIAKLVEKATR